MTPTVHVLWRGSALCGNVHGLPGDWGTDDRVHRWVAFNSIWRGGWKRFATCAECRVAAGRLDQMQDLTAGPLILRDD